MLEYAEVHAGYQPINCKAEIEIYTLDATKPTQSLRSKNPSPDVMP